ncbi:MAG: BrnT family toxin [Patescibacteria group bacterium]|nr:BrnT family toxin [Patescibacteria group bacterium]
MIDLLQLIEFNWDEGNVNKNWTKHGVSKEECEQAFFDSNLKQYKDVIHSEKEERFIILGKTNKGRILYIVFTIREEKIRIISARNLNRKEMHLYEE